MFSPNIHVVSSHADHKYTSPYALVHIHYVIYIYTYVYMYMNSRGSMLLKATTTPTSPAQRAYSESKKVITELDMTGCCENLSCWERTTR